MISPEMDIREAVPEDLGAIRDMVFELAEFEHLTSEVTITEAQLKEALFGDRPTARAIMVHLNGDLAGYAIYFINYSTFSGKPGMYLEDIFIRPAFRRQGLGRAIFLHLAQTAARDNLGRLDFAVLDWNQNALDFYQGLGAKPLSQWLLFRIDGPDLDRLAQGD